MNESSEKYTTINALTEKFDVLSVKVDDLVDTVDKLTALMLNGFERVTQQFQKVELRFQNVELRFQDMEENFVAVRRDILNTNDRFPSFHMFDGLAQRVIVLENDEKRA